MEVDSTIVAVLIQSVVTIASGIFGVFWGKTDGFNKTTIQIRKRQLDDLYNPLMAIFIPHDGNLSDSEAEQVSILIYKYNSLAAPLLIDEWKKALKSKNYSKVYSVLSSNYNWVKKSLGYPYVSSKIDLSHIPSKAMNAMRAVVWMVVSLCIIVVCFWGMTVVEYQVIKTALYSAALVASVMVCYLLIHGFREAMKQ